MSIISDFQITQCPIKIGRNNDCEIRFDESSLSRYHCRIEYSSENWILKDGEESKPSVNGTWLFVDEPFALTDELIIKAGQTLFRVFILLV